MVAHKNRPGLCLKERVREKSLTPQEALDLLKEKEPVLYKQTRTYLWLIRKGAYDLPARS